jgi:hypothetical protein
VVTSQKQSVDNNVAEKIGRQKKIGLRNLPCESHERQKNNSTKKIGLRNQPSHERKKKPFEKKSIATVSCTGSITTVSCAGVGRGVGWAGAV